MQALAGAADDEGADGAVPGGPVSGSYASEQAALKAAFLAAADEADAALKEETGGLVAKRAAAAAAAQEDPATGQHREQDVNKVNKESHSKLSLVCLTGAGLHLQTQKTCNGCRAATGTREPILVEPFLKPMAVCCCTCSC